MTTKNAIAKKMAFSQWPLSVKVIIGVILGIIMGSIFGTREIFLGIKNEHFGQIGILSIKLLRCLATPLILFAILDAFTKITFTAKQGGKLLIICLINVSIAMAIGLTIMNVFRPGEHWQGKIHEMREAINAKGSSVAKKVEDPEAPETTFDLIKNFSYYVPSSLVRPFFYNNVISVVFIGLLAGFAFRRVKENREQSADSNAVKGMKTLERLIETVYEVFVHMLEMVIKTIPYAVFGVVAQVVGALGVGVFKFLWVYMAVIMLGFFFHALVYYPLVAWLVGKKSPKVYLGQGADAILTGLSINSSLGTVPITLRCLERMGVSHASSRLAACIGTNLNNDGITLYEAMTALFLTQALGISLGIGQQFVVILASIFAGAGMAGVPEAGIIVLPLVLSAAGLPEGIVAAAIPLILPVDWILARCRSGVNVMSDMLVAILLDA